MILNKPAQSFFRIKMKLNKRFLYGILYALTFILLINTQQKLLLTITGVENIALVGASYLSAIMIILLNTKFLLNTIIIKAIKWNAFSLFCIFIIFLLILSSITVQKTPLYGALASFIFTISCCNMLYRITSYNLLLMPLILYILFICYRLIQNDFDPRFVFVNSQNWISFYGILLFAPYAYNRFLHSSSINITPSTALSLLSIYSRSRSGIIGAALILTATNLCNRNLRFGIPIIIILIPLGGYLIFSSDFDQYINRFSSLSNFLLDGNGRGTITDGYLKSLEWYNYFIGIDLTDVKINLYATKNLHNSYLNASVGIGLLGVSVFLLIILESFIFFVKHAPGIAIVWLAVLLRVGTDSGALFNFFDISVIYPLYLRTSKLNDIKKLANRSANDNNKRE